MIRTRTPDIAHIYILFDILQAALIRTNLISDFWKFFVVFCNNDATFC